MEIAGLCYHHGEHDLTIFNNFLNLDETYTNKELYDFIHPWNDDVPYVFDTYTFDYCNVYDDVDFFKYLPSSGLVYKGVHDVI